MAKTVRKNNGKSAGLVEKPSKKTASEAVATKAPAKKASAKKTTTTSVVDTAKKSSKVATTDLPVTTIVKQPTAPQNIVVKKILITQPKPDTDKSPYFDLAKKYDLELFFYPFISVEGLSGKDFRKQRVDIYEHTAIVFTSRNAVDHFFRICEEMKAKVSQEMKYFCITEAVALYLQKFILYRKRKVFFSADGTTQGLLDVITKHKTEKYIVPTAESGKNDIHQHMLKYNIKFAEVTLFNTVANDIAQVMKAHRYDMIVFFSPFSVQALYTHDAKYKQKDTLIGAFGPSTTKAVEDAGLRLDVKAPAPNAPSMVAAIDQYLALQQKRK